MVPIFWKYFDIRPTWSDVVMNNEGKRRWSDSFPSISLWIMDGKLRLFMTLKGCSFWNLKYFLSKNKGEGLKRLNCFYGKGLIFQVKYWLGPTRYGKVDIKVTLYDLQNFKRAVSPYQRGKFHCTSGKYQSEAKEHYIILVRLLAQTKSKYIL